MLQSGSNSAVECDLAKVEVAGSNPVSRSRDEKARVPAGFSFYCLFCSDSRIQPLTAYQERQSHQSTSGQSQASRLGHCNVAYPVIQIGEIGELLTFRHVIGK